MSYLKSFMKEAKKATDQVNKIKLRKHLNADALFSTLRKGFDKIDDHRRGKVEISLTDALMSGFAVFFLKDPSLLAFDERRRKGPLNLMSIYGIMGSAKFPVTHPCVTFLMMSIPMISDHFSKIHFDNCNEVRSLKKWSLWKDAIF